MMKYVFIQLLYFVFLLHSFSTFFLYPNLFSQFDATNDPISKITQVLETGLLTVFFCF